MPRKADAPPAYLRVGKRRIRVPRRRWMRLALGFGLLVRGVLPPFGYILLPPALALLSIDLPRIRRWRRRIILRIGRRRRRAASRRDQPASAVSAGGTRATVMQLRPRRFDV